MDPGIAKLIERTRARRGELKELSNDRSPLPSERERSPLKERNLKQISVQSSNSPVKKEIIEDSPSNTVKRLLSRESLENNVADLITRDSPGKKLVSRSYSTKVVSPNKTTITKTVITEKEETYEKKEIISYSGNKEFVDTIGDKFDQISSSFEQNKNVVSCDGQNAINRNQSEINSASVEVDDLVAGRKARLANLASKFKDIDDESTPQRHIQLPKPVTKPLPRMPSPSKHPPVKTDHIRSNSPVKASQHINSQQFISPQDQIASSDILGKHKSPMRCRSPSPSKVVRNTDKTKPDYPLKSNSQLISNLKAQGFQESESKSKLVYTFEDQPTHRREQSASPSRSPVKNNFFVQKDNENKDHDRNISPVRANPFLLKDKLTKSSPTRCEERGRSKAKKPQINANSPSKSIEVAVERAPPKPSRTYETVAVNQHCHQPSLNQCKDGSNNTTSMVDSPALKSVSQKRNMFENHCTPEKEEPDPALMSMSQRKALFEKNKSVPTPIARFGESVTPAMLQKAKPKDLEMTPAEAWKRKRPVSPSKPTSVKVNEVSEQTFTPKVSQPSSDSGITNPGTPLVGKKTSEMHKKLFANSNADWRDTTIARKANEEKQSEMNLLMNRYNHLRNMGGEPSENRKVEISPVKEKTTGTPPTSPPPKESYYPGINSMKRVKVSPPKPGNMYPPLEFDSDTMSSRPESAMSSDTMNTSFESNFTTTASEAPSLGKQIVAASQVSSQDQELSTIAEGTNDSMETDDGEGLSDSVMGAEIDDILDEALEQDDDSAPTPPKVFKSSSSSSGSDQMARSESTTSWEYHTPQPSKYRHENVVSKYQTPLVSINSPLTPQPQVNLDGEEGPLLHTVSFYRKQKPATPVQRIVLNPKLEMHQPDIVESPRATITQKIHLLQEEAGNQMPVIQQASSALNLCRSTKEFFGSSEQVEGERLLLVATHKRGAALNEIQRLKTEGGIGADPRQDQSVRGTVSVCGVSLGLKGEFVDQLRSGDGGDFVHYFLCLVKCAGQVIPTQMVSTSEGLDGTELNFPNLINFRDLNKDFTIHLEVYGLQTRRESLTHDAKYHIKKGKSSFNLTPKLKITKTESKLSRPNVSSPGGPHTIRTSSFAMVGNAVITIGSLTRKNWTLESVPKISPLDGSVRFKLNCHSESQVTNRGFLTMFDDVSGFGAWHRRWFVLEGNSLSFWKYPENEKVQEPIGRLDLGQAVTGNVEICPREICSRMHTFMLETSRPATKEDRDSLVVIKKGGTTILRHLLSADSRSERIAWCDILNKALDNLRAWDTVRPRSSSMSSNASSDTNGSVSTEIW